MVTHATVSEHAHTTLTDKRAHLQPECHNVFRATEKLYKKYKIDSNPSKTSQRHQYKQYDAIKDEVERAWRDVIDLTQLNADNLPDYVVKHRVDIASADSNSSVQHTAQLYSFTQLPGFYIVHNALNVQQQLYWCNKCITEYSAVQHNNLTNLYGDFDTSQLWQQAVQTGDFTHFNRLRWSSLGYHYDWTQRTYSADNRDAVFDAELAALCMHAAELCGHTLSAEAAIVNYYVDGGSMGGHVDDAELTDSRPIVSISLGSDCIFLLGGLIRDVKPVAFRLRSGDITVMSGPSRLYYHGVPRILEHTFDVDAASKYCDGTDVAQQRLLQYLSTARLNMNVRQVIDSEHNFANTVKQSHRKVYV